MRNDCVYKLRRKMQMIAGSIFSPEFMSKIYFKIVMKQKLDLENPKTFNEKIQWYKLNNCLNNKTIIECCDKYRIRKYLKEKNLMEYAIPLVGYWENVNDIQWENLPERFAIKCNHGCAYNLICKDKSKFNIAAAKKSLAKWMKEDFGKFNAEPHYDKIRKGIVCEEYLGDGKSDFLVDYKIHCFNGKPKFVLICSDRTSHGSKECYFDLEWNPLHYSKMDEYAFEKPMSFNKMIEISKRVAKDFPFVRVDFYEVNGKPIIGELTFVPAGGLDNTLTEEADIEIGNMFDITRK